MAREREGHGTDRRIAEPAQRGCKGHGRAEPRRPLHEEAEEPRDEDGLQPAVGGQPRQRVADASSAPGAALEFVEHEGGQHDPEDRGRGMKRLGAGSGERLQGPAESGAKSVSARISAAASPSTPPVPADQCSKPIAPSTNPSGRAAASAVTAPPVASRAACGRGAASLHFSGRKYPGGGDESLRLSSRGAAPPAPPGPAGGGAGLNLRAEGAPRENAPPRGGSCGRRRRPGHPLSSARP